MLQIDSMKKLLDQIGEYRATEKNLEIRKEIRRILNDSEELLEDLLVYLEKYSK